jgi:hypothetical protein
MAQESLNPPSIVDAKTQVSPTAIPVTVPFSVTVAIDSLRDE